MLIFKISRHSKVELLCFSRLRIIGRGRGLIKNQIFKNMAEQEKQIKVNLDPILYALSNVNMGFNKEVFDFLFISGNQARQFRCSPEHAKRIYLLLGKYLKEYEEKFRTLSVQLPEKRETSQEGRIGF